MWVRCVNPATESLGNDELFDGKVEFNSNGTANVSEDLGEVLIDEYSVIVKYNKGD